MERQPDKDEPYLPLNLSGKEVIATRDNTSLFTFIGNLASRNHVFIVYEIIDEENAYGSYIFPTNRLYEGLRDYLIINQYPLHMNLTSVSETDERAYQQHIRELAEQEEIPDYPPEDL